MNIEQEPKYDIVDNKIVNRATGIPIPDDEPVFILRAKDARARQTLWGYMNVCKNLHHQHAIARRYGQFLRWRENNPDAIKEPDTDA